MLTAEAVLSRDYTIPVASADDRRLDLLVSQGQLWWLVTVGEKRMRAQTLTAALTFYNLVLPSPSASAAQEEEPAPASA